MSYFLLKFTPRADFRDTITEAEAAVMREHLTYWQSLADKGIALVVGPVAEPTGTWGMAAFEAQSTEEAEEIMAADPVVINNIGPVTMFPILSAIVRNSFSGT